MRVKTAAISYSRKFNLGNYESLELSVSFWSEVDVDEDESSVCEFLFQQAKQQIKANLPPSMKPVSVEKTLTKYGQPIEHQEIN